MSNTSATSLTHFTCDFQTVSVSLFTSVLPLLILDLFSQLSANHSSFTVTCEIHQTSSRQFYLSCTLDSFSPPKPVSPLSADGNI